jgi:ABC-type transport system involved in multi-copper enzyme maturation permease subunit
MRKLLWKEWHEQSWKLGFGCVVLGALALIGFRSRILSDYTMMMWVGFLGLTLLPILAATGLVPAERGEGSMDSLLALPVKTSQILAAKALMGLALCVGPMLVAATISLVIAGGREIPVAYMLAFYVATTLTTVSLLAWMIALTIRLPSETRAALLSVGILILWMLATAGLTYQSVPGIGLAISPFSFVYGVGGKDEPMHIWWMSDVDLFSKMVIALTAQVVIGWTLWKYAVKWLGN